MTTTLQVLGAIGTWKHSQSLEWLTDRVNEGQKLFRLDAGCSGEDDTIAAESLDEARQIVGDYAIECGMVVDWDGDYVLARYAGNDDAEDDVASTPFEATGWTLTEVELPDDTSTYAILDESERIEKILELTQDQADSRSDDRRFVHLPLGGQVGDRVTVDGDGVAEVEEDAPDVSPDAVYVYAEPTLRAGQVWCASDSTLRRLTLAEAVAEKGADIEFYAASQDEAIGTARKTLASEHASDFSRRCAWRVLEWFDAVDDTCTHSNYTPDSPSYVDGYCADCETDMVSPEYRERAQKEGYGPAVLGPDFGTSPRPDETDC